MGKIINAYIFPHPPIIIPEVGGGREIDAGKTIEAYKKAAKEIKEDNPDTIIMITPHAPFFKDLIYITDTEKTIGGDFRRFGAPEVRLEFENHNLFVEKISSNANYSGITITGPSHKLIKRMGISKDLDHGAMVPLYFISKEINDFKLVHISVADMPYEKLYNFGECIGKSVAEMNEKIVLIASGDLSHSLTWDAPCGYNEKGAIFDKLLTEYLSKGDVDSIINFDENLVEEAAECGLRPIIIMLGALKDYDIYPEVYSYEGPYGVGYMVSSINPEKKSNEDHPLKHMGELVKMEDPYVSLARMALEAYVKEGKTIKPPEGIPHGMLESKAGAFVTIKKKGSLRGCIGTIYPTRKNIAEEIIYNAISAGTRDPRFHPVNEEELVQLIYSVDIMGEPEPIDSILDLDAQKYGVIVRSGNRSGLLLPNIEGVDTPEEQVSIALQKAGIRHHEKYTMERFEVKRYKVE
jgi:AmmeMemoRadiSam system protein A